MKSLSIKLGKLNILSLLFIRMIVANNLKTTLSKTDSTKEFMKFVQEQSPTADKSLVGTLISTLITMTYSSSRTMHEHILEITTFLAKLKTSEDTWMFICLV